MGVPGHGDVRRRDLRIQVDAGGGLAGGRDQVKPADTVRRVRAQHELGRCMPAAEPELVTGTVIIYGGKRTERPAGHGEPRAVRRLQVSHQQQLAADVIVPDRDHLASRHYPPRCPARRRPGVSRAEARDRERPGAGPAGRAVHQPGQPPPLVRRQPALTRAGLVFLAGLADSDGNLEVGPELIGNAGVDSAHGHQRLRHQCEPGGIPPARNPGRGQRPRAPQFGLCQLPQVGFRALAVHVPSVPPQARSSSLVPGLQRRMTPGFRRGDDRSRIDSRARRSVTGLGTAQPGTALRSTSLHVIDVTQRL